MKKYIAYTDGSANWKNGKGGSACVFVEPSLKVLRKGWLNTKTGRAEIHAVIIALQNTPKNTFLTIYSDSLYVIDTIMLNRLQKWLKNDFLGKKNKDLWLIVINLLNEFKKNKGKVILIHVKGHNGNIYNELADSYANYKTFTNFISDI